MAICCLGGLFLIPILRPVFARARLAARENTGCISNLRQIGSAIALYQTDYDGHFPDSKKWMDELNVRGVPETAFHCPTVRATNPSDYGYEFNGALAGAKLNTEMLATPMVIDSTDLVRNASDGMHFPPTGRHIGRGGRANNALLANGSITRMRIR